MRPHVYFLMIVFAGATSGAEAQTCWQREASDRYASLSTVRDEATVRSLMRRQAETGDTRAMVEYAELLRGSMTNDLDESMRWNAREIA